MNEIINFIKDCLMVAGYSMITVIIISVLLCIDIILRKNNIVSWVIKRFNKHLDL